MAKESSFDIVSEPDMNLVANTVNVCNKEISTRYDFRGSNAKLDLQGDVINITGEDDYKITAIQDMLRQKAIKQEVDLRFFDLDAKVEDGPGGSRKQAVAIKKGISKEQAKELNVFIKEQKLKVNSQIQGEAIRVSSKDKDELQKVIQAMRQNDFGIALSFINYR